VIPVCSLLLVCLLPIPSAHEAAGAAGIRHSPRPLGAKVIATPRALRVARRKSYAGIYQRHCEPTGRANARPMTGSAKQSTLSFRGKMDCFASLGRNSELRHGFSMLRGRCGGVALHLSHGRGRRAAPGEGIRSIDTPKPLTRIASVDAIRPLPAGEVTDRPFHPSGSAKGRCRTRNDGLETFCLAV
jgi:hypothetical protein